MQALTHETPIPQEPQEPQQKDKTTPQNDMVPLSAPHPAQQASLESPPEAHKTIEILTEYPKQPVTHNNDHSSQQYALNPQSMVYAQPMPMPTPVYNLNEVPAVVVCPYCRLPTKTVLEQHPSSSTYILAIIFALFCLCLFWIPCAAHWDYDKAWKCERCFAQLASQKHGSPIVATGLMPPVNGTAASMITPVHGVIEVPAQVESRGKRSRHG